MAGGPVFIAPRCTTGWRNSIRSKSIVVVIYVNLTKIHFLRERYSNVKRTTVVLSKAGFSDGLISYSICQCTYFGKNTM